MAKIWDLTNKELKEKLGKFLNAGLDWNSKVSLQLLEQLKDEHDEVRCEWERLSNIFGSQTLSRIRSCLPGLVANGSLRLLEKTLGCERYEVIVSSNGHSRSAEVQREEITETIPFAETDRIITHYNLNASQAETYRFLVQRCLELTTNAVLVTAAQVGEGLGVTSSAAYGRLQSLLKAGVICKVPEKSSTNGMCFKVALKLEDVTALQASDVQSAPTVHVERAEKNVIPALIELLRRSDVQLEPKEAYEKRLKQAQADVNFYYQLVHNYDMVASALGK